MEQQCTVCHEVKPQSDFYIDRWKKTGFKAHCKQCDNNRQRIWRQTMRESRFHSIFNGLSTIVKKVYESVPHQTPWDSNQIHNDLFRSGTSACDLRATRGCLDTLVRCGLVKESTQGMFIRIPVERPEPKANKPLPKQDAAQEPQTEHTNESETMSKTESPIEKIGKLALQANALLAMAKKLTADIETVAIEVEEMFSTRDAETAKLRQLQALLKSLG